MWMHLRFFFLFFFFLGSLHKWKQQSPLTFLWPSPVQSTMHIYGIRGWLGSRLFGREPLKWWVGEVLLEGRVSWNPSIPDFYNRETQLAEWIAKQGQIKKIYIHIFTFISIPPIERTFCWGESLPRTSNSVCSTRFIFKPKCRFYSWNVIGLVWAETGKFTSEVFYNNLEKTL